MSCRRTNRVYNRLATGLQIADNEQADSRFLTLTSPKGGGKRPINRSFQILRNRILRATIERCRFEGFKMNRYFCLRTAEGNGVLHIIFCGGNYIPVQWLKKQWLEIHGAFEVYIEYVHKKKKTVNGLVGYLLDRYLMKQKIERMSYGWRWAWLGFCRSWEVVKQNYAIMRRSVGELKMLANPCNRCSILDKCKYPRRGLTKWAVNHSVDAWRCILWSHPVTSRQIKISWRGYK